MEWNAVSLLEVILHSVFTGFGLLVPIMVLLKTSNLTKLRFKELFILTAVQTLRYSGIIYVMVWLTENRNIERLSLMFNDSSYLLYLVFSPLMYLLLTQCFWFRRLYTKKLPLIILSLLLLLLPSERFVIWVSYFHRDYLPSGWAMHPGSIILQLLLNVLVFFFFIIVLMVLSGKLKKLQGD